MGPLLNIFCGLAVIFLIIAAFIATFVLKDYFEKMFIAWVLTPRSVIKWQIKGSENAPLTFSEFVKIFTVSYFTGHVTEGRVNSLYPDVDDVERENIIRKIRAKRAREFNDRVEREVKKRYRQRYGKF